MDVTVSELMELFLQSPLVTWVSVPGPSPHCWGTSSTPARLQSQQTRPGRVPGKPLDAEDSSGAPGRSSSVPEYRGISSSGARAPGAGPRRALGPAGG